MIKYFFDRAFLLKDNIHNSCMCTCAALEFLTGQHTTETTAHVSKFLLSEHSHISTAQARKQNLAMLVSLSLFPPSFSKVITNPPSNDIP